MVEETFGKELEGTVKVALVVEHEPGVLEDNGTLGVQDTINPFVLDHLVGKSEVGHREETSALLGEGLGVWQVVHVGETRETVRANDSVELLGNLLLLVGEGNSTHDDVLGRGRGGVGAFQDCSTQVQQVVTILHAPGLGVDNGLLHEASVAHVALKAALDILGQSLKELVKLLLDSLALGLPGCKCLGNVLEDREDISGRGSTKVECSKETTLGVQKVDDIGRLGCWASFTIDEGHDVRGGETLDVHVPFVRTVQEIHHPLDSLGMLNISVLVHALPGEQCLDRLTHGLPCGIGCSMVRTEQYNSGLTIVSCSEVEVTRSNNIRGSTLRPVRVGERPFVKELLDGRGRVQDNNGLAQDLDRDHITVFAGLEKTIRMSWRW